MQTVAGSKKVIWVAILLILVTGVIHAIDAPGSFDDAAYKGWLFVANAIAAVVAAVGIARGGQRWGWLLGLLVAGGSILGYVISRTTGLPGMEPEVWTEPLGIVSLLVEGGFVAIAAWAFMRLLRTNAASVHTDHNVMQQPM